MLAGYNGYPGQRIRSLLEQGSFSEAWHFLDEWAKWPGRSRLAGAKRAVAELTQGTLLNDFLRRLNGMQTLPAWMNAAPLEERGLSAVIRKFARPRTSRAGDWLPNWRFH